MQTKILLAGEGGQGIQSAAKILAEAAKEAGKFVSYLPSFGVEQRGAPSVAFLILSDQEIPYPRFLRADIIAVLRERALQSIKNYLAPESTVIFDNSTFSPAAFAALPAVFKLLGLPASEIVLEKFGSGSFNILVCGKLCAVIGLDRKKSWQGVLRVLGGKFKTETVKEKNRLAFDFGFNFSFQSGRFEKPALSPVSGDIVTKTKEKTALVISDRCKGCGLCLAVCPAGALEFSVKTGIYGTPIPKIDLDKCTLCGNCFRICPDAAVKVEKNLSLN